MIASCTKMPTTCIVKLLRAWNWSRKTLRENIWRTKYFRELVVVIWLQWTPALQQKNDSTMLDHTLALLYNLKSLVNEEGNQMEMETSVLEQLEILSEMMHEDSASLPSSYSDHRSLYIAAAPAPMSWIQPLEIVDYYWVGWKLEMVLLPLLVLILLALHRHRHPLARPCTNKQDNNKKKKKNDSDNDDGIIIIIKKNEKPMTRTI